MKTELQFLYEIRRLFRDSATPLEDIEKEVEQRINGLKQVDDAIYFDSSAVNELYKEYLRYRKTELRYKVTPTIIKSHQLLLDPLTEDQKVEAIQHQFGKGWQGFFLPKHLNTHTNGNRKTSAERIAASSNERGQRFDYD